ncbi:pyridoxamine 5'-phosphate oxidase family protein [Pelovirga terrestris]|uniref:Pyridoxamine 5'-phosphate oxidase family protein n=1 Tax=Pelovirga terrestris TaxID=2771352 RepID=A0A8J6QPB9_9BACT|nr:pyridoxamine 5'-phosphate oxidase family protein [Pelovirga terrestris]MBD1400256.1 pyridoxamine 5'-phosphate oxidase family protein [Pelovirga terrestris]
MTLNEYFSTSQGIGILSTADNLGNVTSAIYARPRVLADGTLVCLMRERLSYQNICTNPHATYMFIESAAGYQGVRLYLHKIDEMNDPQMAQQMTRKSLTARQDQEKGPKHLVRFRVEKSLALIGAQERRFTDS